MCMVDVDGAYEVLHVSFRQKRQRCIRASRSEPPEARASIVARVAIELASSVLDLLMTNAEPDADALVAEATEALIRYLEPWMEATA